MNIKALPFNEDPLYVVTRFQPCAFEVFVQLQGRLLLKSTEYGIAAAGTGAKVAVAVADGPKHIGATLQLYA
jgi:hypothetical protein